MSTGELEEEKLQRYFDGELSEPEADEVRRVLEASEAERARLHRLQRLRYMVQVAAEDTSRDLDASALYERVERGIQTEDQAGADGEDASAAPYLRAVGGRSRRRTRRAATRLVAGGTLAAAAAVLLAVFGPWAGGKRQTRVEQPHEHGQQPAVVRDEGKKAYANAPRGSKVIDYNFGTKTGTVFEVEGEGGDPVAVVWIDEGAP